MQGFSIMNAPAPQLLRDYLIYLSTIKGRSPRTVEAYYNDLRLFLRYMMASHSGMPIPADDPNLESIPFASISNDIILGARLSDAYSFLAYVQSINNNNAKTRARKVSSLRGFYKYLQSKTDLMEENPMEQLEIPAQRKSLPKYLTLEESLHLLESIEGKDRERDYCIITILLNCGIRLSELVGIKLSDIRDDTLTVLGKGNKERKVAPSDDVWCRFEDWLKVRGEEGCENVFVAVKKGDNIQPYWAITASAIYQLLKSRAGDSQVSAFTPHDLRRTFATRLLESGADINTVRQAMGHASIITTQRYDKRDEHRVEEATRRVPL